MPMPSSDAVTQLILDQLSGIPLTTDPEVAKRQSIQAIVDQIRAMVLQATVNVPGTGLTATDPISGPLPVVGAATGTVT